MGSREDNNKQVSPRRHGVSTATVSMQQCIKKKNFGDASGFILLPHILLLFEVESIPSESSRSEDLPRAKALPGMGHPLQSSNRVWYSFPLQSVNYCTFTFLFKHTALE